MSRQKVTGGAVVVSSGIGDPQPRVVCLREPAQYLTRAVSSAAVTARRDQVGGAEQVYVVEVNAEAVFSISRA